MSAEVEILVIDDEIPSLRLLTELLEREGYRVRPTGNAQLAIDSALAFPPALILTDVRMPEIDGFEVCRRLKEDERTRDVPVIFISSLQDVDARVQGFKAGGVDFITKPFQEQEVLARVRTHTLLHQMQQHLERLVEERTEELRASERRLSLIFDSVGDVLFYIRVEPDGCFRFLSVNHAFLKATGLTIDQVVGKRIEEVIPETSIQLVRDNYRQSIEENRIVRWEEISVYPSGERIGAVSIAPVVNEEGICTHLVGSVHDVTEHRQTEKKLRESKERYELAIAGSAAGIWDWDFRSGEVFYSGRLKELLGYEAEVPWDSVDEFWDRLHPDEEQAIRADLDRHLAKDIPFRVDCRLLTKSEDYRWFYVRGQASWDEADKPLRMAGSIIDITERKLAQGNILKSERRFRALMEQSPLPIAIYKPDGKIDQVNSAWLRQWGINEEEIEEIKTKYNILEDEQLVDLGVDPLIKRAFSGENVVLPAIEYSGKRATGEVHLEHIKVKTVWIQVHLAPIMNENREIIFIVVTNVDITALKNSEEESQRQREVLARVNRVARMEQLTGSIAHELNQPLTGILSSAQAGELAIGKGECDHEEMLSIMAEIAADAKRASEVIKGLREIYREQKAEHVPVDITALVGDTEQLLHSEFVMQKVELKTECAPSDPMVSGNRVQIQQVLVNIILNAAEAMRDTPQGSRYMHIVTACEAKEVKAWVEDSGPGIDEDIIDTIFEPLATWKPGGTGMGLAISNSIIEAHGGRMWAENRPEGGARVGFTLPSMKGDGKA